MRITSTMWLAVMIACHNEYGFLSESVTAQPVDIHPEEITQCGFSAVPGTNITLGLFWEYDCNPVFVTTDEPWSRDIASVGFRAQDILGHPFYQIWYSGRPTEDFGNWSIGYAVSDDGIDWITHSANPLLQSEYDWDIDNADNVQVIWSPQDQEYLMGYQGYNIDRGQWGLGVATSPDGVTWDWVSHYPVIDFSGSSGGLDYCWPLGLAHTTSGGITGWIAAQPNTGSTGTSRRCQVYPIEVSSPTDWRVITHPALVAERGKFDEAGIASTAVVELDGVMYMFYVGFAWWESHGNYISSRDHKLGLAYSVDNGETWKKHPDNPITQVLSTGPDEEGVVSDVSAQVVGSRIHLWITDYYEELGTDAIGYYLFEPGWLPGEEPAAP